MMRVLPPLPVRAKVEPSGKSCAVRPKASEIRNPAPVTKGQHSAVAGLYPIRRQRQFFAVFIDKPR